MTNSARLRLLVVDRRHLAPNDVDRRLPRGSLVVLRSAMVHLHHHLLVVLALRPRSANHSLGRLVNLWNPGCPT